MNHHRLEERQWRTVGGCSQQIMTMVEVCLHGDKLDQYANSIYPQEWSVTLFTILEGGPIVWISGLLVPTGGVI